MDKLDRIARAIRDKAIDMGIADPYMDLNKIQELKDARDALSAAGEKYLEKGSMKYEAFKKMEHEVNDQMNTTGFAHSATLLNRMQSMQALIHSGSNAQNDEAKKELKEHLDQPISKATKLLTKALDATPEERTGAFASYAKDRLAGGTEITATLESHLDQKKKPGPDANFKSQHGHTASITHKTGPKGQNLVEVNVKSIMHHKEAAEDMAKLLHTQGFKRGEFETDGKTHKKDKNGKDIKGDVIEIKGLAQLEEEEKKLIDKCLHEKDPGKALANLIEVIMFMLKKDAIEQQALECATRGYEVRDMPDRLMPTVEKRRATFAKSEEREQENVKELTKRGELPDVQLGQSTKKQPQQEGATISPDTSDSTPPTPPRPNL